MPAPELWDLIVSVFGSVSHVSDRSGQPDNDGHKQHKSQKKINVMENIGSFPSNVQSSRQEALLYVFEGNEAVINMIIEGRSPTMRHVSRTPRVALGWLFDRINLDSKIHIKYTDTKNQLADILTKGNFTRDEWNHSLCLFHISHFSSTVCSDTMAKRKQQQSGEERVTAKSRPMMNLVASTPSFVSCSTSVSPGKNITEVKIHGNQLLEKTDQGALIEAQIYLKPLIITSTSMEIFSSTNYSKLDNDRAWSAQEWKAEGTTHDRSGLPDKASWRVFQHVVLITETLFSTEPRNPYGTKSY